MKTLVFFGATGNLFSRKILPALIAFPPEELEGLKIIALGRRFATQQEYEDFLRSFHPQAGRVLERVTYLRSDARDEQLLARLVPHLRGEEVFFYLTTLPSVYPEILRQLRRWRQDHSLPRISIALEKPFGHDEQSFLLLEGELRDLFPEERIFYVDHYLGKSTVLSLIVLKAENLFVEKLLSREYLREVRIAVCEEEGVEDREAFYEETGAIRDILQNHILQLLTLLAIDIPPLCEEDKRECQSFQKKVAREKVRVLEEIRLPKAQEILLGQYQGYREAVRHPHSTTETLVSLPLFIDNPRWRGVPFWILTGKKMAEKRSFIEAIFHSVTPLPNRLLIEIQPEERIDLFINVKTPQMDLDSAMVRLNFSYSGTFGAKSPEAYQKILYDFLHHDRTLFPDSRFIRQSWKIIDALLETIRENRCLPVPYPPGTLKAEDLFTVTRFGRCP